MEFPASQNKEMTITRPFGLEIGTSACSPNMFYFSRKKRDSAPTPSLRSKEDLYLQSISL
jgi:hypothetical protein